VIYPRPGQDTQRVLSELLDLKPDEIDRLRDGGSFGYQEAHVRAGIPKGA